MKDFFEALLLALIVLVGAVVLFAITLGSVYANPLLGNRYVTEIKRDANGNILRRADVRAAFKRIHPCPSTHKATGACPGWAMDHTIPLACFGEDSVSNMAWIPTVAKSGWKDWMKDRYELMIYAIGAGSAICKNKIVIITDKVY